jgi:hypothetical protein
MFTLDEVVPWGRSFDEYRQMFELTDADLRSTILGCADGPASFNSEATRRGVRVVSCDPLYQWNAAQIRGRIAATCDQVLDETRRNAHEFVWDTIPSVEELGTQRMAAMQTFLEDYDHGNRKGRYVGAELPRLPFAGASFDLAVCSHFLFLYTAHLTQAFHQAALLDMCRVAREIRIFPLLALGGRPSPYLAGVVDHLRESGHDVSIETVPYEFQRGGNQMMRVRTPRTQC